MNLHAGFNLNKVSRYTLDFPDPPGGYGALYMNAKVVQAIRKRVAEDKGYYAYLYRAEPSSRPLIDLWKNPSAANRGRVIAAINQAASKLLDVLVNREGIHTRGYQYWGGGQKAMNHGIWIDELLANPQTTAAERQQVKAAAVLFANVLWDNDFVPMDNPHGINLGNPNMPAMQASYRRFYGLLLANHPTLVEKVKRIEPDTRRLLTRIVNEHGAEIGCPHYRGASFGPTMNTLLQLKQRGFEDAFQTEPRLTKLAEFYMNLLTPPEPYVGNRRAVMALGDSSTEVSSLYGQLANGFRDADPKLSARLMGAWLANGKPHDPHSGTTLLRIDESLPAADPQLADANFPGYCSVLRHGWGTPNETVLWFVNGDH